MQKTKIWLRFRQDDENFCIKAGIIYHRIPCFGYVIKENDRPGTLLVDKLKALGVPAGK